ncbi:MAG: tol-pal system protein YbgF [Alphaproteobacteria bacterium]
MLTLRMRSTGSAVFLACAAALSPVGAQAQDTSGLGQKLERLEADLKDLQRYVYTGGTLPEPSTAATTAVGGGDRVAQFEVRLSALEEQIRDLRGSLEETSFKFRQIESRLDKLVADIDVRLTAIERGGAGAGVTGEAPAATATVGEGGTLVLTPPEDEAAPEPALAALPPGSAMDQYNYAFGLLRKADYDGAERALNAFVQAHGEDPLAGNALYWLGETYYVREDYNRAAVTFLRGYREFPDGSKAPDSLLKLGMSLGKLGKKVEACASLTELGKKFPNASATIQDKATTEAAALGCG